MGVIRFFRFTPGSQPPTKIQEMYQWFKEELENSSIEPFDTFEVSEEGPVNGSHNNLPLATIIFKGMLTLKKAFVYIKNRL